MATGGSEDGAGRPPPYLSASAIVGGTVKGHHLLKIEGFSYTKEMLPTGKFIKSRSFKVGDHLWCLFYYPNGYRTAPGFVSLYLKLVVAVGEQPVKARATFILFNRAGKPVMSIAAGMHGFTVSEGGFGYDKFISTEILEKSGCVRDDSFAILCDVTVVRAVRTEDRTPLVVLEVPPPELHRHLSGLLESNDGADVTFLVAGEVVRAHRNVLAARSPVFRAELFGAMKESGGNAVVKVDDMEADVFRCLLAFIYTDALPETKTKQEEDELVMMAQHLLVAADRYGMQRLMRLCEKKLCGHVDLGSAATLMALAEQHHCRGLKEACLRFINSTATMDAVMASDGFEHLIKSCPSLVKELIVRGFKTFALKLGSVSVACKVVQEDKFMLN